MKEIRTIKFYRINEPYGEFSNFAPFPIELKGKVWPTTEHFFQAQKFTGTEREEKIRVTAAPMVAARMGRSRKHSLRSDWEKVKIEIMRTALRAKFEQHTALRELLLSTRDAVLIEHTSNDNYWGDGGDGKGQNMLGRLLMAIRGEFQSKTA